ncbi:hypothetical protein U2F10_25745 [Leptothoe sp. EHU-05/26/07-4]
MVTVQNGEGAQGFTGYTTPDGDCVNPAYMAEFFDQMGDALQTAICDGRIEDRVFVLEQFAAMQTVLDTLVNQEGFTAQVQQLQNLIESLQDQDGDGVNDLQQVKDRLDALESIYNSQQQQINQHGDQITNLQTNQTTIQTTQATQGQQIADLQGQLENIDLDSLGLDADAIRCEAVTDIYNAVQAGVNAFQQRLQVNCVLPTSLDQVNAESDTQPPAEPPAGDSGGDGEDVPDTL